MDAQDLTGRRFGKYEVEEPLARGGMALVYRGHDTVLDRPVAIKVLDPALASTEPGAAERFRREAITAANLEHPNIVPVYDVGESDGLQYIAMRYVPGETLRDLLDEEGRLTPDRALAVIRPVAAALDYAHERGVIHRDVKPGNIMIEPNGHVWLADFGIARAASQNSLTNTGKVMGTVEYLAPEQISGAQVTPAADIYSLGIVLYEMLSGEPPFTAEHMAATLYKHVHEAPSPLNVPGLPPGINRVVEQALDKNPALRFPTADALARALAPFAEAPTTTATPHAAPTIAVQPGQVAVPVRPTPVANGFDMRLIAPIAAVVLLLLVVGAFALANRDKGTPAAGLGTATPIAANGAATNTPGGPPNETVTLAPEETSVAAIQTPAAPTAIPTPPPGEQPAFAAPAPGYGGIRRDGNGPDLYMGRANRPPTIDGDLSDWSGAEGFTPVKVIQNAQGWKGPDDLSAEFRMGYDSANFYFSAVVTDNVHVQNNLTRRFDLWKGDDIELWFDFDLTGDFALDPGNGDDWQLGLSPGDFKGWPPQAVFFRPEQVTGSEKGVSVAARPRGEAGYVLEAAMPWPMPGWTPQPGGAIGFCASVGDNDTPRTAQQEKMSSTCTRMKWNVPTTFGMLFY